MKIKELNKMNDADMSKMLTEKREALRVLRFNVSGSTTRNVHEARMLRRDIARILTEARTRRAHTKA